MDVEPIESVASSSIFGGLGCRPHKGAHAGGFEGERWSNARTANASGRFISESITSAGAACHPLQSSGSASSPALAAALVGQTTGCSLSSGAIDV